ncbi:hypothetical protein EG328_006991 [Venturia inaequalis]|uniref:Uncharacterized protein n=1 Tax=Venturia inaequalis TaxID=5025 RepID=A0A8H3YU40_VENIN|nr:hypothetical protein EG328_006991 [Venturia inaequalis]
MGRLVGSLNPSRDISVVQRTFDDDDDKDEDEDKSEDEDEVEYKDDNNKPLSTLLQIFGPTRPPSTPL